MATSAKLSELVPSRFVHLTPPNEENIERIRVDLETGSKLILNPVHVFKNEAGKYELLAGHDRTEAARRAGVTEVPVREFRSGLNTDDAILSHFCIENLMRKEVSKAAIAETWIERHPDWTDGKVAEVSGCTREHVSKTRSVMLEEERWQPVATVIGKDDVERPARPRTPRVRNTTPAKPKVESADDMAAIVTKPKPAPAPAAPSVTTEKAPEERASSEGLGTLPEPRIDETAPAPLPAVHIGGGAPNATLEPSPPANVASDNDLPVVHGAVVDEPAEPVASLPGHVVTALTISHLPLTRAQLSVLTDEDEARLTALGRWCQTVVMARRRVLVAA